MILYHAVIIQLLQILQIGTLVFILPPTIVAVTHTSLPFLILLNMQFSKPFIVFVSVSSFAAVLAVTGVFLYAKGVFSRAEAEVADVNSSDGSKDDGVKGGEHPEKVAVDPLKPVDDLKKLVDDKADGKGAKDDKQPAVANAPQEKKINDKAVKDEEPPVFVDPLIKAAEDVRTELGDVVCNALKTTAFEDQGNL